MLCGAIQDVSNRAANRRPGDERRLIGAGERGDDLHVRRCIRGRRRNRFCVDGNGIAARARRARRGDDVTISAAERAARICESCAGRRVVERRVKWNVTDFVENCAALNCVKICAGNCAPIQRDGIVRACDDHNRSCRNASGNSCRWSCSRTLRRICARAGRIDRLHNVIICRAV